MTRPTGPAPCRPRTVVGVRMDFVTSIETVGEHTSSRFTARSTRSPRPPCATICGTSSRTPEPSTSSSTSRPSPSSTRPRSARSSASSGGCGSATDTSGSCSPDRRSAHLRAHRARRRARSLPRSGRGGQRSERVNRSRVPEPLSRGPISTSSAIARMIASPIPSSPSSSARHSVTDSLSKPGPSSSTTTSSCWSSLNVSWIVTSPCPSA